MLKENYEIKSFIEYLLNLQKKITENIENIDDQAKFSSDKWERDEGGGGESKILRNGKYLSKLVSISRMFVEKAFRHQL